MSFPPVPLFPLWESLGPAQETSQSPKEGKGSESPTGLAGLPGEVLLKGCVCWNKREELGVLFGGKEQHLQPLCRRGVRGWEGTLRGELRDLPWNGGGVGGVGG